MTPCNTRSVGTVQNCLQSLHHRLLLTTACGLSCSCWFISNTTPIIPVLQLPSAFPTHSHKTLLPVPSVLSRVSPLISVLESWRSSACAIPHYTVAWPLEAWVPKGTCFQSCSGVPHYRLQHPQILHQFLIPASAVGVPLFSWHYPVFWGTQPWGRMQKFTDYDLSVHFLSSLHWLLLASRPSLLHLGNDFTASSTSSLQIQWGFDLTQESHLMQTVITFLVLPIVPSFTGPESCFYWISCTSSFNLMREKAYIN